MAVTDFQWASIPCPYDLAVKNTEASTTIAAGNVVKLDTSNLLSGTQGNFGVLQGTADAIPFGVAMESIAAGKSGRARPMGPVVQATASGAITAGTSVQADSAGKVKTAVTDKAALGVALTTTTTDGDPILVMLQAAEKHA